jgi:hypothetical protein
MEYPQPAISGYNRAVNNIATSLVWRECTPDLFLIRLIAATL